MPQPWLSFCQRTAVIIADGFCVFSFPKNHLSGRKLLPLRAAKPMELWPFAWTILFQAHITGWLLKQLKQPHHGLLPPVFKVMVYLLPPSWRKGAHGLMYRGLQCDFCFLTVSKCVLWCLARSLELLNAFWQPGCWQRYGFSPVWLLKWILRFSSLEKAFLQPSN